MRSAALAVLLLLSASAAPRAEIAQDRQRELLNLLRHDCGACHGITLKGGLGPALRPTALAEKPDRALIDAILYGRPGTPMPPWQQFLSEQEAAWLVGKMRDATDLK